MAAIGGIKETLNYDLIASLLETAIRHQKAVGEAVKTLERAAQTLEGQHLSIQQQVSALPSHLSREVAATLSDSVATIQSGLMSAAEDAAERITQKVATANIRADDARLAYESAAKFAIWKISIPGLLLILVIALGLWETGQWTLTRVETLREEKTRLQNAVAELASQGGRALLPCQTESGVHMLCARIDERWSVGPIPGHRGTYAVIDTR